MSDKTKTVLIIGSGLSGATIANLCAEKGARVIVLEKRDHIAGNVYDEIDKETGIRISKYGAHLFHTNDEEVWNFVQRFGSWKRWDHTVVADLSGTYVPVPVNCTTVNTMFGTSIQTEDEMKTWLKGQQIPKEAPGNSEEVALSRVGPTLYETLFRPYTIKQWAKEPRELEASVLERIPIRCNFDPRYFSDKFQALPAEGYTRIVERILDHPQISVHLNYSWEKYLENKTDFPTPDEIVFTGPIDSYFRNSGLPPLEYRSIDFTWERLPLPGYYQPNSVVNYPSAQTPLTRCVEYKHFLHQKSDWTILSKETTCDRGEPYYPVPTQRNRDLFARYSELAKNEQKIHFVGRLASYKYYNMDQAIRAALDYFQEHLVKKLTNN
jgi:UDP-galactopyranose mutase